MAALNRRPLFGIRKQLTDRIKRVGRKGLAQITKVERFFFELEVYR